MKYIYIVSKLLAFLFIFILFIYLLVLKRKKVSLKSKSKLIILKFYIFLTSQSIANKLSISNVSNILSIHCKFRQDLPTGRA